ncbi:hypothetical protein [Halocola ammonii]
MRLDTTLLSRLLVLSSIFVFPGFSRAQQCDHDSHSHEENCGLEPIFEDQFSFIPPPEDYHYGEEREANILVEYNGFTAEAQEAFAYAVDIWASILNSDMTIEIEANFEATASNVLGYAGSNGYFKNFSGAPMTSTYYPQALANKLSGNDMNPTSEDITCTFNSQMNWYYGTDGNVPSGQFDFVSVVLHELGHGLGFAGSASANALEGSVGFGITLSVYDQFVEDSDGTPIDDYETPSPELGDFLTGGNVFWTGPALLELNNNQSAELYAPSFWNTGSSYSHLNENSYGSGSGNSLMTPFLGTAEAIHNPGPIVRGMFEDMGWDVATACSIENVTAGNQSNCGQNGNTYDQQVTLTYSDAPSSGSVIVNGQTFAVQGSPQTVTLQNLPSNGQQVDLEVSFSEDVLCVSNFENVVQAPLSCCANFRLLEVWPSQEQIQIKNFGDCQADVSGYVIISENSIGVIENMQVLNGSTQIPPNGVVTLAWPNWNPGSQKRELALYRPGANPENTDHLIDFVQWQNSGSMHENIAQEAGIWQQGDYVEAVSPYTFIGSENDYGVEFWQYSSEPCDIIDLEAGIQSVCNGASQTYSQEVIVTYQNAPSSGQLSVKGQTFEITESPQSVVLTGLEANGQPQIVTAYFTSETSCSMSLYNIFSAPDPCQPEDNENCPGDFDGDGFRTVNDLLVLLGELNNDCGGNCLTDLTGNNITSTEDLLLFVNLIGMPCP